MPFLTDLSQHDRVELKIGESVIRLKIIKRTGSKVRLSVTAGNEVDITKVDVRKEASMHNKKDRQ